MHLASHFAKVESNQKPRTRSSAVLGFRGRRSFQPSVFLNTPVPTSVLDHVTNAEDIYETNIFSTGSVVKVLRTNLEWETKMLKSLGQKPLEEVDKASSLSVTEFLNSWTAALKQDTGIPRQFPV